MWLAFVMPTTCFCGNLNSLRIINECCSQSRQADVPLSPYYIVVFNSYNVFLVKCVSYHIITCDFVIFIFSLVTNGSAVRGVV